MSTFLPTNQLIALRYLSGLMEANARMIGAKVCAERGDGNGGSNIIAVGGVLAGLLRKRGWASYMPDLHAWRITRAGRAVLAEQDAPAASALPTAKDGDTNGR